VAVLLAAAAIVVGAGVGVAIVISSQSDGDTVTTVFEDAPTITHVQTTTVAGPTVTAPATPPVQGAVQTVEQHGYDVVERAGYDPHNTLQVLIGNLSASATGHVQKAFFFVDGNYIGTDSTKDSNSIQLGDVGDDTVGLQYALFRPRDPECCPTGGTANVDYHWTGSKLVPQQPIPPSSYDAPLSRR
jgi:hypothetical protein